VTDANLILGYLAADAPLAGGVKLDREAAADAIERLATALGLDPLQAAEGIVRVADAEMVRALRVVTVQRGIDPRRYALLAFGGAGPLHAAQIAEQLGIETILCPRASGVLAALGLIVSARRRDAQRSVFLSGGSLTAEEVAERVGELGTQARSALGDEQADLRAVYELRYRGQAFELPIAADLDAQPAALRERFEAEHEERYGYSDPDQELELVTIRVSAMVAGADVELAAPSDADDADHERGARDGVIGGERVELEVLRGTPGTEIQGPAVVELPESTVLVPRGWRGEADATGTVRLHRTT
jgi:N-methylhydantoinase A